MNESHAIQPEDRLLDAGEVATWLGVSRRTIYRLAAEGEIPVVKIGPRRWRFRVGAITAWLDPTRGEGT